MAAKTTTPKAPETPLSKKYNMVEIIAPLGKKTEQSLIIGVNGVNYNIPTDGKKHLVPDFVAYEYNRSREAEIQFSMLQDEMVANSQFAGK